MSPLRYTPDDLILNPDGSVFHLHLRPGQLARKLVVMGDPDRVTGMASLLDSIELDVRNREFHTVTGLFQGKRISLVSHGIGSGNIDIVVNELDALSNIDLGRRIPREPAVRLDIVRLGTCGGLHPDLPLGSFLASEKSIEMGGPLRFYAHTESVRDVAFEEAFRQGTDYDPSWPLPTVVSADSDLLERIGRDDMIRGVTLQGPGFYGPQGRRLRLPLQRPGFNESLERFRFQGHRITNYEMESAALSGLSALMGHRAVTVCLVVANRYVKEANPDYHERMKDLGRLVLERI